MKDRKKTIIIEIIIISIIIILIILTSINLISLKNIRESQNIQSHSEQVSLDRIDDELIRPKYSVYLFSKYTGNCSQNDIIASLNKLAIELVPNYYLELKGKTEDQIHQYFISNSFKSSIDEAKVAISDEEAFKELIKEISNLKEDKLNFLKFSFERESIHNENDGTKATINIDYSGNEKVKINVIVKNEKNSNGSIIEVCK